MAALRRSRVGIAVSIALLAGCTTMPSDNPSSGTDAPSPTADGGQAEVCPEIDLRFTTGEPVRLAGTWTQFSGTKLFYVSQTRSCVWWAGGFATDATVDRSRNEGMGEYTLVFAGAVEPDFKVHGTWSSVRACQCPNLPRGSGTVTLEIDLTGDGGLVMRGIEAVGADLYWFQAMTKISDQSILP